MRTVLVGTALASLFAGTALCHAEVTITPHLASRSDRPDQIVVSGVKNQPSQTLDQVLQVFVDDDSVNQVPVLGKVSWTKGKLVWRPRFSFEQGVSYKAVLRLNGEINEKQFIVPTLTTEPTAILNVYPTADTLPSNLLKIYLQFSAPMTQGDSYRHLKLSTRSGEVVEFPFLELQQELWNPEGTRLTVLFDPGRVKQGLKPREVAGPVLVPGEEYKLTIDPQWLDASGSPLASPFTKTFLATAPDVVQPDPKDWKLFVPAAETAEPLSLRFPEPLDRAMLDHSLGVVGEAGQSVPGTVTVLFNEKIWKFLPNQPWKQGVYKIHVKSTLEDRAGNSVGRPFEVDLKKNTQADFSTSLKFRVQPYAEMSFEEKALRNWHRWRGPDASGSSAFADPPLRWDAKKNIRWKMPIPGQGSSTPVVWEDKVFLTTAERTDRRAANPPEADPRARTSPPEHYYRFSLICLDRASGTIVWERAVANTVPHEGLHQTNTYAAASATTDGQRVYAFFGSRGLYCFDMRGNLLWDRQFGKMHTRRGWGEGASPLVSENKLAVTWDHEDQSKIFVLDGETGETIWEKERDEPSTWATPLAIHAKGHHQLLVSGTNRVRSYDFASGEVLWEYGPLTVNAIPSPVTIDDFAIFMSGYRGNKAVAIPLDAKGDLTGTDQTIWELNRGTPYVPSPLLYHDLLYFTRSNSSLLTCVEAKTGQTVIPPERLDELDNVYASPVGAAGRIYFVDRNGTTLVTSAGTPFKKLAVNRLDEPIDGSPVVVGRQLFLRAHEHLYCIEERD